METIYVLPIIFAICASICYSMAKKRNASVPVWVVMGALFGPLAILALLFTKPKIGVARS